jgi:hypothetical protein
VLEDDGIQVYEEGKQVLEDDGIEIDAVDSWES